MKRLQELISRYPIFTKLAALPKAVQMGVGAGIIALVVVSLLWMREPAYKVLFSNLADKDGGAIVSALSKMNVPYQMSESGTAILVPADKVHQTRMMLAEQGLPQGGGVGFELMKDTQFGASQFAEQVTYQRAIEGELARSIEAMHLISSARVHLALPKETLFVRDKKQPTASVLLNLHPGRSLSEGQVSAIAWLVAASVADMTVQNVSIVDQTGRLLSSKDAHDAVSASASKVKLTREVEQDAVTRIIAILSPIVGAQNVHAQVSAQLDFNQREQTSEVYRPNQSPDKAAVRSEQVSESAQKGVVPAQGVPGALSNEPPAAPVAPITTAPAQGNQEEPEDNRPSSTQRNATINYEVDRTISHVKESVGQLQRLSVAVVLNYRQNEEGEYVPLAEEQIDIIRDLVKEAIGYSEERGDTISIANSQFTASEPSIPVWKDPFYQNLALEIVKILALALAAALIWFKVVMPFVRRATGADMQPAFEGGAGGVNMAQAVDPEELAQEAKKASERYEDAISSVRQIAKDDPRAAALVLREWMQLHRKENND